MFNLLKKAAVAMVALGSTVVMAETKLQGAGATFPAPVYSKWVTEYQKLHPDIKIDYQAIGSGGGIKGITDKTVDFAGSDAPLSADEQKNMGGAEVIVQIPSTAGGVVPAFNVPGVSEINFSGEVLADIYIGKISKWNDPKIVALNPGVTLPSTVITPAYRTDGSGTNYVWTNYLCTQSADFKAAVGSGKSVKWPIGQGGQGNDGVTAIVKKTAGAIGYVEAAYADQNKLSYGAVRNKSGKFVKASPASVSAAGAGAVEMMKGTVLAANIWDQAGDTAYPIASFTYLIVYKDLRNLKTREQALALTEFLNWAITGGQQFCSDLDYAPLAESVTAKAQAALKEITFQGATMASAK